MLDTRHDISLCGIAGAKFVNGHHPQRLSLALQQLAHQALDRFGLAAALHENLQHETVLVHSAPEPVLLATDRNDGLIEMSLVAEPIN